MNTEDLNPKTTPPSLTEQAQQLVEEWLAACPYDFSPDDPKALAKSANYKFDLIKRVASFASEAAKVRDNGWLKWLRDEFDADSREDVQQMWRTVKSDSVFLQKKAATAALEQAAQWQPIETAPDATYPTHWMLLPQSPTIAAIGDDKEEQR